MLHSDKFRSGKIENVLIIGLFSLFTICIFLLVITGIKQYEKTNHFLDANQNQRNVLNYLNDVIETHDASGNISVAEPDGITALALRYTKDDAVHTIYIYEYNDTLRELDINEDDTFQPENGTVVLSLKEFHPEFVSGQLLYISFTDDSGKSHSMHFKLHSTRGKEASK